MTIVDELPVRTECELCHQLMALVRGPSSYRSRPPTPQGYRLGYLVEQADRSYPICAPCLANVMNIAA